MNQLKTFVLAGSFAAASIASAAPPDNAPASDVVAVGEAAQLATEGEGILCRTEKPIGSKRAVRVCRDRAELEKAREETREVMRSRGSPPKGPPLPLIRGG